MSTNHCKYQDIKKKASSFIVEYSMLEEYEYFG